MHRQNNLFEGLVMQEAFHNRRFFRAAEPLCAEFKSLLL